jgi:hypothetical protein
VTAHRVADVRFVPGRDDASPITCTCSWTGTVAEWQAHRGPLDKNGAAKTLGPALGAERLRKYPVKL